MLKKLLIFISPPIAVCRYGCTSCCALPITGFWIGGLFMVGYYFVEGQHANNLIRTGSLVSGLALLGISIVWAKMTIIQVAREGCSDEKSRGICRNIPSIHDNSDPLAEVEKAKEQ